MIFVDTGAWKALKDPDDQHHEEATAFHRELAKGGHGALVTSDYVLDEALTLLNVSIGPKYAMSLLDEVLSGTSVHLVWVNEELFRGAALRFKAGGERGWSFTDCTSFELMHRLGLKDAFAFDKHFAEAGYNRLPAI